MIGLGLLITLAVYVYLASATARFVGRRAQSESARYLTIVAFILIPTWDIIPGQLYFAHLCETEGGIKVFKHIEVDKAYFQPNGLVDEKQLISSGGLLIERKNDANFSPLFHIAKFESVLRETQSREVLGIEVHLVHYGGWLNANLSPGPGKRCDSYSPYKDVWTEVVKPKAAASSRGGE